MRLFFLMLMLIVASSVADERFPARPIQLVVPSGTGDAVDLVGRAFAETLARSLKAQVVVVNRDGAGGTIGTGYVAAARADGHTLGFGPMTPITVAPHLIRSLAYRLEDFDFVCQVFESIVAVAVGPESGLRSLADLAAAARADPGKVTYGHSGVASLSQLAAEAIATDARVRFMPVAYRGDAQMVPQLLLGRLDFGLPSVGLASGYAELRVLAVVSNARVAALPDVPTVAEQGFAAIPPGMNGLYVPRGLRSGMLAALERECEWATQDARFQTLVTRAALSIAYLDRSAFARRVITDYDAKGALIRRLDLPVQ